MSGRNIGSGIDDLRSAVLRKMARILIRSGTFRRHLGALDRDYDPEFLRAARFLRGASDAEALFIRDLVNEAKSAHANADQHQDLWVVHETAGKRGGSFVEFGATDGISGSNIPCHVSGERRRAAAKTNDAGRECPSGNSAAPSETAACGSPAAPACVPPLSSGASHHRRRENADAPSTWAFSIGVGQR
jgi:hypothetical protein